MSDKHPLKEKVQDEVEKAIKVMFDDPVPKTAEIAHKAALEAIQAKQLPPDEAVRQATHGAMSALFLSERDIVRSLVREQEGTLRLRVEDLMTTGVATCQLDDTMESAMETMTSGHFRHLPVVTADGTLDGIVSLGDLVKLRLAELEEQLAASS